MGKYIRTHAFAIIRAQSFLWSSYDPCCVCLLLAGPNDIVTLSDGTIIFTDAEFGVTGGFARGGELQEAAYLIPPSGPARVLINQLPSTLNGLALSPDQRTLYVSTTSHSQEIPDLVSGRSRSVYAYDLVSIGGGIFAQNERLFAVIDHGYPDGLKVDASGNVFASSDDGVDVFGPSGTLLGKIVVPRSQTTSQNVNNLVFAGNKLVLLHNTNVLLLHLNTSVDAGTTSTAAAGK